MRYLIAAVAALSLMAMLGCDGDSSDWLLGRWETTRPVKTIYEFKPDGVVTLTIGEDPEPTVLSRTYSLLDDKITFQIDEAKKRILRISGRRTNSFAATIFSDETKLERERRYQRERALAGDPRAIAWGAARGLLSEESCKALSWRGVKFDWGDAKIRSITKGRSTKWMPMPEHLANAMRKLKSLQRPEPGDKVFPARWAPPLASFEFKRVKPPPAPVDNSVDDARKRAAESIVGAARRKR